MCIPFSLKTIKGILLYSSFIVTYNHSDEDRRGVSHILFIDSNFIMIIYMIIYMCDALFQTTN